MSAKCPGETVPVIGHWTTPIIDGRVLFLLSKPIRSIHEYKVSLVCVIQYKPIRTIFVEGTDKCHWFLGLKNFASLSIWIKTCIGWDAMEWSSILLFIRSLMQCMWVVFVQFVCWWCGKRVGPVLIRTNQYSRVVEYSVRSDAYTGCVFSTHQYRKQQQAGMLSQQATGNYILQNQICAHNLSPTIFFCIYKQNIKRQTSTSSYTLHHLSTKLN